MIKLLSHMQFSKDIKSLCCLHGHIFQNIRSTIQEKGMIDFEIHNFQVINTYKK